MCEAAREWRFYVLDMLRFGERALSYTAQLTQSQFLDSGLSYDATVRTLELLGEAATHIPDQVRRTHEEIPWRMIIATRNRLIHGYCRDRWRHALEHHYPGLARAVAAPAATRRPHPSGKHVDPSGQRAQDAAARHR